MAKQKNSFNSGEYSSGKEVFNGFISGLTFTNKPVQYTVIDGMAIFEGDIVLGTADEIGARTQAIASGKMDTMEDDVQNGVVITGSQYRWPNGIMPYEIDSSLPNKARVTDAIAHWTSKTNLGFVKRTSANASQHPNYVRFRPATNVCSSSVGMRGGRQYINLASGCGKSATIHEIGHAWGLWHEQSREDRDSHITIHWANIKSGKEHNFNQHVSDGDDIGSYDFDSLMHYSKYAFSKNGQPTITTKPSGKSIGGKSGLSKGDIAAVHAIYTSWHNSKTISRVYATYHSKNAWALIQGVGWRKVNPSSKDGVTNLFLALCEAKANAKPVNVYIDGSKIYRAYL